MQQQQQMAEDGAGFGFARPPPAPGMVADAPQAALAELSECCRELDEGHRSWAAHPSGSGSGGGDSWMAQEIMLLKLLTASYFLSTSGLQFPLCFY
ncbi:hypothetical protein ZWY2020_004592 [Hordeum vulgare]|nr:hypothetical protein ZWY2020_004592 [Hordeum vulgare]